MTIKYLKTLINDFNQKNGTTYGIVKVQNRYYNFVRHNVESHNITVLSSGMTCRESIKYFDGFREGFKLNNQSCVK